MSENKSGLNYHPGIEPGIDFIWGSDQDQYTEQQAVTEAPSQEEENQIVQ